MGDKTPTYQRERRPPPRDRALAALTSQQHGVVTRAQLRERGKSESAIDWAVRNGRLHRLHRGVYAVGHPVVTREGRCIAAVLAAGTGAVLSHRSAAALWGVGVREGKVVDVTAPGARRGTAGIALHRTRRLDADETTTRRGIAVTTLPRTLADLADVLDERELSRVVHEAEVAHSLGEPALREAVRRSAGRRGAGRLARVVADGRDRSRSALERRFLKLCRDHGLPRPESNAEVAGLECDFVWREHRLVAETDGWAFHRTRRAFELDRGRDQQLTRAGFRTLRFTHRQVHDDAADVAATVRAALG